MKDRQDEFDFPLSGNDKLGQLLPTGQRTFRALSCKDRSALVVTDPLERALSLCFSGTHHLDENSAGFVRALDFTKKVNAYPLHPCRGLEPKMKSETIYCGHRYLSCVETCMYSGQQNHCRNVIRVHVSKNRWSRLRERINLGNPVVFHSHPAHHTEAADIVDVEWLQKEEAEILIVHPRTAVFVP